MNVFRTKITLLVIFNYNYTKYILSLLFFLAVFVRSSPSPFSTHHSSPGALSSSTASANATSTCASNRRSVAYRNNSDSTTITINSCSSTKAFQAKGKRPKFCFWAKPNKTCKVLNRNGFFKQRSFAFGKQVLLSTPSSLSILRVCDKESGPKKHPEPIQSRLMKALPFLGVKLEKYRMRGLDAGYS
uniref:Uncharacterized protein n=1 Tax=Salix viminalis TaxID=40686 RepID=A0A6N2KB12_SALVM